MESKKFTVEREEGAGSAEVNSVHSFDVCIWLKAVLRIVE